MRQVPLAVQLITYISDSCSREPFATEVAEKLCFEHVARGHNPEPKPNTSGDGQIWGSPRGKNSMSNMSDFYHFLLGSIFNLKCSLLAKRWSYRGQSHLKSNHKSCTTLRHHLVPFPKYGRGKGSKLTLLNEGEGGLEEPPPLIIQIWFLKITKNAYLGKSPIFCQAGRGQKWSVAYRYRELFISLVSEICSTGKKVSESCHLKFWVPLHTEKWSKLAQGY